METHAMLAAYWEESSWTDQGHLCLEVDNGEAGDDGGWGTGFNPAMAGGKDNLAENFLLIWNFFYTFGEKTWFEKSSWGEIKVCGPFALFCV